MEELISVKFSKIMQTQAYTVIVLGTDEKQFPIYVEPHVGRLIQLTLTGGHSPRPLTYELLHHLFHAMKIRVRQVVINDLEETIYKARLFLEREEEKISHLYEIDARPSDALILALQEQVPVFVTRTVYEAAIPLQE